MDFAVAKLQHWDFDVANGRHHHLHGDALRCAWPSLLPASRALLRDGKRRGDAARHCAEVDVLAAPTCAEYNDELLVASAMRTDAASFVPEGQAGAQATEVAALGLIEAQNGTIAALVAALRRRVVLRPRSEGGHGVEHQGRGHRRERDQGLRGPGRGRRLRGRGRRWQRGPGRGRELRGRRRRRDAAGGWQLEQGLGPRPRVQHGLHGRLGVRHAVVDEGVKHGVQDERSGKAGGSHGGGTAQQVRDRPRWQLAAAAAMRASQEQGARELDEIVADGLECIEGELGVDDVEPAIEWARFRAKTMMEVYGYLG